MTHVRELLDQPRPTDPVAWSTGFAALDELTGGGFHPGEVWLVTGTPGQGCTTLLTQWAGRLAVQHELLTWMISPRDSSQSCTARLLASTGKLPIRDLTTRGNDTQPGLRETQETLSQSELFVHTGAAASVPTWTNADAYRAALLDDADLVSGVTPARIRELAVSRALVIASFPRHLLVRDPHPDGDLEPSWARAADIIIEVRSRGLTEAVPRERFGEAELSVLKHRHGPTSVVTVAFQGHYARFVDLR